MEINYQLVHLPKESLKKIELPEKNYSIGWSYGKEFLGSKPDLLKGSFYARLDPLSKNQPIRDNVWPEEIPEMKSTFEDLGNTIRQVGLVILENIDRYIKNNIPSYNLNYPKIISESKENTGRLLYYFRQNRIKGFQEAFNKENNTTIDFDSGESNWCEWHNDHGSLTGLVSADYINEDGSIAKDLKLTKSGLFIQNRKGDFVRCTYGEEDLAFQLGKTLQIHSGGLLHVTPHAVKFMDDTPKHIARRTFALFMEPNMGDLLKVPEGVDPKEIKTEDLYKFIPKIEERFEEGMSFEMFTKKTFELYYKLNNN